MDDENKVEETNVPAEESNSAPETVEEAVAGSDTAPEEVEEVADEEEGEVL